jgi:RsiW-degrading membrane proteinase PrsW (M82 family)
VSRLALALLLGIAAAGLSHYSYVGLGAFGLRFDALLLADTSPAGLLLYAVAVIGPVEEISKMLPFLLVILHLRHFDESLDGIIYASFIALGYAAAENWSYLEYLTPWQAAARSFASPVIHIVFASTWGYLIAAARIRSKPIAGPALLGLLISSVLHGVYDFLVILNPFNSLPLAGALILIIWVWRLRLIQRLQKDQTNGRV